MKNSLKLLFLLLLVTASSCKKALKDIEDYFPIISNVQATPQPDGSVLVEADIESEGSTPLEYVGFCVSSTDTLPDMLENQLIGEVADGKIRAVYGGGFEPFTTYYFRAFATNSYGYVQSAATKVNQIIAASVDPPCAQTPNTANIGGGQPTATVFDVTSISQTVDGWEIRATTFDGPTITLKFGSQLTNGIFTTTSFSSPAEKTVQVSFTQDFISGSLENGGYVYVRTITPGVYEITICDAPWSLNGGSPLYFNCRFVTP